MNSNQRVYEAIKNKMSRNLEQYIQLDTPYTQEETPMVLEIINSDEILQTVIDRSIQISRQTFEEHIPNTMVGLAYVDYYCTSSAFYCLEDATDSRHTFFALNFNMVVMFFEILQ
ncbi:MAG: hypothetical protein HOP30_07295 [Cyclobacteriaceae bacterium]|nr:hypothetical protein [Cyclobacteriaceae bacterium]